MKNLDVLKQIAVGIHELFGPQCEVVIHDFADLERSIIHLEGNITGRSVGGAATDLLLSQVRQGTTDTDVYNYQTQMPNGRVMKSCTMFLRDDRGQAYGAFCINFDLTPFTAFQGFLGKFLSTSDQGVSETLSDDFHSTIRAVLFETIMESGTEAPILTREEKIELIARLDDKGIFQVKKSVPLIADELGLSRSTIYNYLTETRKDPLSNPDED
jgi:predicted transcriptional regulator YheO